MSCEVGEETERLENELCSGKDRKRNVRGKRNWKGVRQGYPLSSTLFNIYLEDLMKNCFLNMEV